jgi:hypothetical protein
MVLFLSKKFLRTRSAPYWSDPEPDCPLFSQVPNQICPFLVRSRTRLPLIGQTPDLPLISQVPNQICSYWSDPEPDLPLIGQISDQIAPYWSEPDYWSDPYSEIPVFMYCRFVESSLFKYFWFKTNIAGLRTLGIVFFMPK